MHGMRRIVGAIAGRLMALVSLGAAMPAAPAMGQAAPAQDAATLAKKLRA